MSQLLFARCRPNIVCQNRDLFENYEAARLPVAMKQWIPVNLVKIALVTVATVVIHSFISDNSNKKPIVFSETKLKFI